VSLERYESARTLRLALDAARSTGRTVGLVPTMGALHPGHESLIERAARECDEVVVSIFVNPLQFSDTDDLVRYPRDEAADMDTCARSGATRVFVPSVAEVYPTWPAPQLTMVSVRQLDACWEGASRPGHFDGVATVVAKLFALVGPCRAYFGEKDFQQLAVLRAMVADLWFPIEIEGCATVREPDGLAMSSRNIRLGSAERGSAVVLSQALSAGVAAIGDGVDAPARIAHLVSDVCAQQPLVELEYAVVVDPQSLEVPDVITPGRAYRLLIAAHVGGVRLIDNAQAVGAVAASESVSPGASLQTSTNPATGQAERSAVS
jgi:pantoate--beta-alanine ligase